MARPDDNPNQMVVEDTDLLSASLELLRHHIPGWPAHGPEGAPVYLRQNFSAKQTLSATFLGPVFKMPRLRALGVVVDADQEFDSRWANISNFAASHGCANVPKEMPPDGLILETNDGRRFGAWIMPDNRSPGMLETFCRTLVHDENAPLWKYAQECSVTAKGHGADYIPPHVEKANIHAWLAWRNPPGGGIGLAIKKRLLNPHAGRAVAFVGWCKSLYGLSSNDLNAPSKPTR